MDLRIAYRYLMSFLLYSIYTIIGYVKESTSRPMTHVLSELSIVGVGCVLLYIIVLVVKTFLWGIPLTYHLTIRGFS